MSEFAAPPTAAERESWFDRDEALGADAAEPVEADEEAEAEQEGPADPQEWLDQLTAELRRAEQGSFGSGPRDALAARVRLAQAYSELGDSVSAAPLAVQNVAQAEELFPSSEGMLAQLREFRDAACEAAGWTAAMMRTAEPEPVVVVVEGSTEPMLIDELTGQADEALLGDRSPADPEADADANTDAEADEADEAENEILTGAFTADSQGVVETPTALAVAEPEQIEDAEEVRSPSTAIDLAAYEEIVRLRFELRDAQRTIARLRHTNQKLREALEYEPE
jgi:hypothetical protein